MATYHERVEIPHATYEEWKTNTLGNKYDVDGIPAEQPYQCWDFAAEFWYNVGFTDRTSRGSFFPDTGGNDAKGIWLNREINKGDKFDLVNTLLELKVGDVICFGNDPFGHVGFVDHEYTSGAYISILSQNNDLPQVTVEYFPVASFQGAFRYKGWHQQPTPTSAKRTHFPWVLYARKLRNRNIYF